MGCNKFSEEEVKQLSKNPYVIKVSKSSITYSENLKKEFIERMNEGELPREILRELGFDTKTLGEKRIYSIIYRFRNYSLRADGVKDTRKDNVKTGRPSTKELTVDEKIKKLEHKNLVLEQENDFLKKMIFLVKKREWEKSVQEKNTK